MTRVTIELGTFDRRIDDRAHERHWLERDGECGDRRWRSTILAPLGGCAARIRFIGGFVRAAVHSPMW